MEHIKRLYEFDDLSDLLGDLEDIGIAPNKGFVFVITNIHGTTTYEMIIAKDWPEVADKYNDIGVIKGQGRNIASYLAEMKKSRQIVNWDILDGFTAKTNIKGYKKWDSADPYLTVKIMDHFFTNGETILKNLAVNKITSPPGIDTLDKF